ncbi:siderophore ABC transporter substrate-binding protein [Humidisolicoccus flavus]|uniref:siderophore ABC transporter substrate-binding protein n=1 Tax=Humidisolicoccus flavus TaxID=3111414 RepID=UPI0032530C8C
MSTTRTKFGAIALFATASMLLAGCSAQSPDASTPSGSSDAGTSDVITIDTTNGAVEVPVNPERVVALDNTSFETLRDLGITPVAVPKGLLPDVGYEDWIADESILDVGMHREPNLEAVSEAEPDLIIGGYRFQDYQDDLESIALTIDIAGNDEYADGWVESLKHQTETLGQIFEKEDEAAAIIEELEAAESEAAAATNGETVFLSVVSAGKIDNGAGRIGRILEPLNLVDVFAGEEGDVHGDSGLAPETIAQANPDWVIVLDRDAAAGEGEVLPAEQVFAAQEAFANTTFTTEDHIIYLDPYFYVREGIQAYTEAYEQIATAFTK